MSAALGELHSLRLKAASPRSSDVAYRTVFFPRAEQTVGTHKHRGHSGSRTAGVASAGSSFPTKREKCLVGPARSASPVEQRPSCRGGVMAPPAADVFGPAPPGVVVDSCVARTLFPFMHSAAHRRYTKQQTIRVLGGFVLLLVCGRQDWSAKESGSGVVLFVVVSGVEKRILRILTCTRCSKFSRFPFQLDMRQN